MSEVQIQEQREEHTYLKYVLFGAALIQVQDVSGNCGVKLLSLSARAEKGMAGRRMEFDAPCE